VKQFDPSVPKVVSDSFGWITLALHNREVTAQMCT